MNRKSFHIVIVIIWGLLIAYLTYDFSAKANVNFIQFNYQWDNQKIVDTIGDVEIDSISHDFISLRDNFRDSKELITDNTFIISAKQDNYFRASEIIQRNNKIIFSGVKWINHIPDRNTKRGSLVIVDLPIVQVKGKTAITLGDSQIIWREGRALRKNLSKKKKLVFVGDHSDVYGYSFVGDPFFTSSEILEKIQDSPTADYIILFFGAQDKGLDVHIRDMNICKILEILQRKEGVEKIFAITLPPSPNFKFNAFNNSFNSQLIKCAKEKGKVEVVDLNGYLKEKSNYLAEDDVHLNKNGYLYLNKLLIQKIP